MTYEFLQHYWCFVVALLGALLVFLLFVQGANSVARSLGYTEEGRRLVYVDDYPFHLCAPGR